MTLDSLIVQLQELRKQYDGETKVQISLVDGHDGYDISNPVIVSESVENVYDFWTGENAVRTVHVVQLHATA